MSWNDFWLLLGCCAATILICRTVPLFVLKKRKLPKAARQALELIPPSAFAALVANDLLMPGMFAGGLWPAALPIIAAICVVLIALKTRSLLWSAVGGVVAYGLLLLI